MTYELAALSSDPKSDTSTDETEIDGALVAFLRCLDRLESLIHAETDSLLARRPIDFEESNLRKARALMEFIRVSRALPSQHALVVSQRLAKLQDSLAENSSVLEQNLRATIEIASLMVKTIQSEESDGTYSNNTLPKR